MRTLVLGLFSPTTDLADELRRTSQGEVVERDAVSVLQGLPIPDADLTIVAIAPPGTAVGEAALIADVSDPVAVGAWEAAIRAALPQLRRKKVAIVDATDPERATRVIRDACGINRQDLELGFAHGWGVPASGDGHPTYESMTGAVGSHEAFDEPTLPPADQLVNVFAHEFLVSTEARRREAALFDRAISAVGGLVPQHRIEVRAPDPYAPHYGLDAAQDVGGYRAWLRNHRASHEREHKAIASGLATSAAGPLLSVVVPIYRPDIELLRSCVRSVTSQSYPSWQLCLCDDASDDRALNTFLHELGRQPRVRVTRRKENGGISAATNDAARLATGEFLVFMDQDDELAEGALAHLAKAVVDNGDVDVIYTDEDKLDLGGERMEPHFKPDWSPDLLLSQMYIGHLLVVRRELFERLNGLRSEYDGSQDFDLALRATEQARQVVHIPRVAYHWRKLEGSSALDYRAKPYADVAARAAIADALRRRGEDGTVEDGLCEGTFRVRRAIHNPPLVSIIIPFRDGAALLRKCIDSLHSTAGYEHWEALLVDNRSWEPETLALTQQLRSDPKVRLLEYDNAFNWSAINNWAAGHASGDVLLFLNSDVEGSREGWLSALVEHSERPQVGVVGARLLYPHGTVQHAGVVLGMGGGVAWHAFCHAPGSAPGYFAQAKTIRNFSAVTGACMMVRRAVFEEIDGFDESLAVGFSDVDLCLQVGEKGLSLVYTPFAELIHYESATRGRAEFEAVETVELFRRWGPRIRNDPYFNPNLDIHRSDFGIAPGAEEVDKWRHVLSLAERSSSSSGRTSV